MEDLNLNPIPSEKCHPPFFSANEIAIPKNYK